MLLELQRGGRTQPRTPVNQSEDPSLRPFVWRSIGPASMGGRIDDVEAVENNPFTYYLGFATGGVYVNFMPDDEGERVAKAYGSNHERLAKVKTAYDPDNLFRVNWNVAPE